MYESSHHPASLEKTSFLITGAAGFIGSHLAEYLVKYNAGKIILVDNLSTGNKTNIEPFLKSGNVTFHEKDVNDTEFMARITEGVDFVLHQAALGSVPRSIKDPLSTHAANATGFISVLEACRRSKVRKLIYASSSSVYGDSEELPKVEGRTGRVKSPYAITKVSNELYAGLYARMHGMSVVGLRYFNIFGPRQNPSGPYAAAIPLFMLEALKGGNPVVYGDGEQSRDFTFVENAVQANIRALYAGENISGSVFNIACGERYTLNQVLDLLGKLSGKKLEARYEKERAGDIRDSHASIELATKKLGYKPEIKLEEGLKLTLDWYARNS